MDTAFQGISPATLRALASALETGSISPSYSAPALGQHLPDGMENAVAAELSRWAELGFTGRQVAAFLRSLAAEREAGGRFGSKVDLVWSGPEVQGAYSRDTSVVAAELFKTANRSVLVSTYVVTQGKQVFKPLAERMEEIPQLRVRLFLNIDRPYRNKEPENQLLKEYVDEFRRRQWPGSRLPEVFYEPRSLVQNAGPRAVLHAKCIVVDEATAFVTSANFTMAAQVRNLEAGVLVRDAGFAKALTAQFEMLVAAGQLRRLPGI